MTLERPAAKITRINAHLVTLFDEKNGIMLFKKVEACVAEWLTPKTAGLEVRGSSLACRVVSLDKELYSTLSLFTQVYKWVPATDCWGLTPRWTSIFSRHLAVHLCGII